MTFNKTTLGIVAASTLFASLGSTASAASISPLALDHGGNGIGAPWHQYRDHDWRESDAERDYGERDYRDAERYRDAPYYADERSHRSGEYRRGDRYYARSGYGDRVYPSTRIWRGRDGRTYCQRSDGTTGLVIGGAIGALIGRGVDRGYNRSLGTILGAAGGALLGREVARGEQRCR